MESSSSNKKKETPKRRRFTQSTILEHFHAECGDCIKEGTTRTTHLTAHHKNGDRSNISLENLEILCVRHHRNREGTLYKKRDYR